jgi:fucose permease
MENKMRANLKQIALTQTLAYCAIVAAAILVSNQYGIKTGIAVGLLAWALLPYGGTK